MVMLYLQSVKHTKAADLSLLPPLPKATFPNGVNLKTSLGIGVNSVTGTISTINAINNYIYSAGSMRAGNYILDMPFKRA